MPATNVLRYLPRCQPASDIPENLGRFLVRSEKASGNDCELIPTVKWKLEVS